MKKKSFHEYKVKNKATIHSTILIAGDDESFLQQLGKNLQRTKLQINYVLNGAEAISHIVDNYYTLLLLDYRLPDMTGKDVIKILLERQCNIPFIIMISHGDEKAAVEMMKLGARDYFVKDPVFLDMLPLVVKRVLKQLETKENLVEAEEKIVECQKQLQSLVSQLTLTEERERRQIATDLHDRIGQALALSKMKLGGLRELTSPIGQNGDVDIVCNLIDQIIQDTRSLTFDICPIHLYHLSFDKVLEFLVEKIHEQYGITTCLENNGTPEPLNDDLRVLLYRTVHELLINIVKHAQAQSAKVSIQKDRNNIRIKVEDDGIGFDTTKIQYHVGKQSGFGLFSLQERLHYLGGQIEFKSKHRHGTRVSLVVPLKGNGKTIREEVRCV